MRSQVQGAERHLGDTWGDSEIEQEGVISGMAIWVSKIRKFYGEIENGDEIKFLRNFFTSQTPGINLNLTELVILEWAVGDKFYCFVFVPKKVRYKSKNFLS